MIPLRDVIPSRTFPFVTIVIIVLNALAWILYLLALFPDVETAVTDVLEEELSTIQGLRTLSSSSSEENSEIILEFNLDRAVEPRGTELAPSVPRERGRAVAGASSGRVPLPLWMSGTP